MACALLIRLTYGILVACLLLSTCTLYFVLAASGGTMGGSDFSSSTSSSSSSSSLSYSSSSDYELLTNNIENESRDFSIDGFLIFIIAFIIVLLLFAILSDSETCASLYKLQVACYGDVRPLQRVLNEIARTSTTSTRKDFHRMLTDTLLLLSRQSDCIISVFSTVDQKSNIEDVEKQFNQLSFEEREKFDFESLVNVDGILKQRAIASKTSDNGESYLVVTILLVAKKTYQVLSTKDNEKLKAVLKYLAHSIRIKDTLAVQVLWTPQDEADTLSKEEMLANYPQLPIHRENIYGASATKSA